NFGMHDERGHMGRTDEKAPETLGARAVKAPLAKRRRLEAGIELGGKRPYRGRRESAAKDHIALVSKMPTGWQPLLGSVGACSVDVHSRLPYAARAAAAAGAMPAAARRAGVS